MSTLLARTESLIQWFHLLGQNESVFFPVQVDDMNYRFEAMTPETEIQLDHYLPTVVPPIKKLMPQDDNLIAYELTTEGEWRVHNTLDESTRILAGVRPCDVHAIALMDDVFGCGVSDPYYLERRKRTTIVAITCQEACDECCFCDAVGSRMAYETADVVLDRQEEDQWVVEAKTDCGRALLKRMPPDATILKSPDNPASSKGKIGRAFDGTLEDVRNAVTNQWESPVWDKHVVDCFSCGSCNLVCPTCYCFDIKDEPALTKTSGTRSRSWDGCMLPQFASVAGGHNFRPNPAGRQRHRVKRKFDYLPRSMKAESYCVGCGRCGRQCTADIDIFDIVQDLVKEEVGR